MCFRLYIMGHLLTNHHISADSDKVDWLCCRIPETCLLPLLRDVKAAQPVAADD